jgi:formylglycine-generating enzyme required for sulfatase activity
MRMRLAIIVVTAAVVGAGPWLQSPRGIDLPERVRLPAASYVYRPAGEFRIGTRIVDAPLQQMLARRDLEIMRYQVTEADYARCTDEGACAELGGGGGLDFPQTGVNYADAVAYAQWFSSQTGQHWRLPTDAEWMRAATGRAFDDALTPEATSSDPSRRWLASYRREAALRRAPDPERHPKGSFAESDFGVADMAGNVWEWTETCFQNGILTPDGQTIADSADYCGVRSVQGKHRSFVITFVRDARSGGCATGVPPDYLGFRLVHED